MAPIFLPPYYVNLLPHDLYRLFEAVPQKLGPQDFVTAYHPLPCTPKILHPQDTVQLTSDLDKVDAGTDAGVVERMKQHALLQGREVVDILYLLLIGNRDEGDVRQRSHAILRHLAQNILVLGH